MANSVSHSTAPASARRVAIVHDTNVYGGVEILLLLYLRHIDLRRYSPVVLVPGYTDNFRSSPARFIQQVEKLGLPLMRLPARPNTPGLNFITQVRQTRQFFKHEGFDVVHIHTCHPFGARIATISARLAGVPVLIRTEHMSPPPVSAISRFVLKPLDWMTDSIITVSDANLEDQVNLVHRDRKKLYRLYDGIEIKHFRRKRSVWEAKRKIGLNPNIPVVGSVGRLSPEKGHTFLVEAAPRILQEYGPVNFLLIGEGPLSEQIKEMIKDYGLEPYFHLTGFLSGAGLRNHMEAIDVGVLPSTSEGLPLVLLEFMSLGIPPVTSSVPCFREAIIEGESGLIASLEEKDSLADQIVKLLHNPEKAFNMGQAAIERVRTQFTIQRHATEMMDFYDKAIASKSQKGFSLSRNIWGMN